MYSLDKQNYMLGLSAINIFLEKYTKEHAFKSGGFTPWLTKKDKII